MRRSIVNIAAALVVVAAGLPLMGSVAGAQDAPPCDGDLVSASIEAESLPGGEWRVEKACVAKESFYTGVYEEQYPFAIGYATVQYADGHSGRMAALEVQLRDDLTIALVGMEDEATGTLKFAATLQGAELAGTSALASGEGLSIPPFEGAVVSFSLGDTEAPWPTETTTTTTLPIPTVPEITSTLVPETTEPPVTTVPESTTTAPPEVTETTIPAEPDTSTTVPTSTP